jgi:hypothetical protein
MATPTQAEQELADRLADVDNWEDRVAGIAQALADQRERHESELLGLKLAAGLQLAEAAAGAVFDFLNWLTPQNIRLMYWGKGSSHTVPEGELFERWKKEQGR